MTKPAPYSHTDTAEREAIATLKYFIDQQFIKSEIRECDKTPNRDGTLELVDQDEMPIGKLEVQIKKIPKGATTYSCPSSLIGYSRVCGLPFLLICVDTAIQKIFWKPITHMMPEFKDGQNSFTIHFSDPSDTVDTNKNYIYKWINLIGEHNNRRSKIAELEKEIKHKVSLIEIPKEKISSMLYRYDQYTL